ncbi:HAD family hydrolase [Paraflavitalea sp. CAU 1676]|uniref:HAD family hydrolase n=1 Tax=Paraflavitalea sp. CAU 1676 TaxID=3032598 RepID=UPI0023DA95F7|nr:HAD family hydrolase [Paraflavitalea sp. CAU 1676]MDF2187982.1 HAD family hydrolase [Paraflavitalea sp. CAU 1676]
MEEKCDKLLVLDLDETLIHATTTELDVPFAFRVDQYFVYERPGVKEFLVNISRHFSIAVWSTASDAYVDKIVQQITPPGVEMVAVWGRSKCTSRRDLVYDTFSFEKRLDKLKSKGYTLDKILIVDDSPSKSRSNYGNAIYINPFTGDAGDQDLRLLFDYLVTLKDAPNVRSIEKRGWRK